VPGGGVRTGMVRGVGGHRWGGGVVRGGAAGGRVVDGPASYGAVTDALLRRGRVSVSCGGVGGAAVVGGGTAGCGGRRVRRLGLAVRFEPPPSPTAMTVAVVGESDTRWGAAPIVARLAELAASDELVVVYGSDEPARPRLGANVLLVGLRDRLPRHSVVALRV